MSWNDLACKLLARFFPSSKKTKTRSEIVIFKQKEDESLYSVWERFKRLLQDCPHHNQTNKVLAYTFIEGLYSETKIVIDVAESGQMLEKSFDEIYALLYKFSKSNTSGFFGESINKMAMVLNKQKVQLVQQVQLFCEVCV